jgi:hypothetical protein
MENRQEKAGKRWTVIALLEKILEFCIFSGISLAAGIQTR